VLPRIFPARTSADIRQAAALFHEYAASLPIDLGFQGFDDELAGLPGRFAPPDGELLLALEDENAVLGCVALRPLESPAVCEMKRLYVRPKARGLGVGRALVAAIIAGAEQRGYAEMRLDSLPTMARAVALYRRFGFVEIPAYCYNPMPGTTYMAKRLAARD